MKDHWETIHVQKHPANVSWYQPHLNISLKLIEQVGLNPNSSIIDVGGGFSTLVDDLLKKSVKHITVLDISGQALAAAKTRLGDRASGVSWLEADVVQVQLPQNAYDTWHDRAVFHFLVNAEDRQRYVRVMRASLKSDGQLIMATFSLDGPPRCSGLEVVRYSADMLQTELGSDFRLMETLEEEHHTPSNMIQKFTYCRFKKT